MTWLRCDVDKGKQKKSLVSTLWCGVCRKYEERIRSSNHKTSNIVDHATSDQHKAAMMRLRGDQAKGRNDHIASYSPIAWSLLSTEIVVSFLVRFFPFFPLYKTPFNNVLTLLLHV